MAWSDKEEELHDGDFLEDDGRSALVKADWGDLGFYLLVAAVGVTFASVGIGALFASGAGELVSLALLFVCVVVLGQPKEVRRERGKIYWCITVILIGAALLFVSGLVQFTTSIVRVVVWLYLEGSLFLQFLVVFSYTLIFVFPFLFFLWWAGCFKPSRLFGLRNLLRFLPILVLCALAMVAFQSISDSFIYWPYYIGLIVEMFLSFLPFFLCWALMIASKCLSLEDGVGLQYVSPRNLGRNTLVIAALVAGVGVGLVIAIPAFNITLWSDALTSILEKINGGVDYSILRTPSIRDSYFELRNEAILLMELKALALSGLGILILFSLGAITWLALSLMRRSIKSLNKVKSLLLIAFAAVLCFLVCVSADMSVYLGFSDPVFFGIPPELLYEIAGFIMIPLSFAAMVVIASYVSLGKRESEDADFSTSAEADGADELSDSSKEASE